MKADISILGLFSIKTEDMKFWQLLVLILIGVLLVIAVINWLKVYAAPLFGIQGIVSIIQAIKARSP